MVYQWYPGHMSKAKRQMQEDLKLIDAVVELVDARIPLSSKNPDIDELAKGKCRVIILNKADLADDKVTAKWLEYYKSKGFFAVTVNSKNTKDARKVGDVIRAACKEKIERDRKKGITGRHIRAMIVGIPNVGKSTFINSFAGKACTKTGNKPGVTKGKQWIRLSEGIELLDTPGILWPKFDDQAVGMRIAFIGSINDDILIPEELATELLSFLHSDYEGMVADKYGIEESEDALVTLENIARKRACMKKGGELDLEKAAGFVTDDYRNGRIGRISLERPGKEELE